MRNIDDIMRKMYPADPLMQELKDAAFEVLLLNPGSDQGDWAQELVANYPTEVVDALGVSPESVYASLADMWSEDYYDTASDLEKSFSEWADAFCNEEAVSLYYALVEAREGLND